MGDELIGVVAATITFVIIQKYLMKQEIRISLVLIFMLTFIFGLAVLRILRGA